MTFGWLWLALAVAGRHWLVLAVSGWLWLVLVPFWLWPCLWMALAGLAALAGWLPGWWAVGEACSTTKKTAPIQAWVFLGGSSTSPPYDVLLSLVSFFGFGFQKFSKFRPSIK